MQHSKWRIDLPIYPSSNLRRLATTGWFVLLLIVVISQTFIWWQYLLIMFATGLISVFCAWQRLPIQHMTQPQDSVGNIVEGNRQAGWRLLTENDETWQGTLIDLQDWHYCVCMHFEITEPLPRYLYVLIWRDQLEAHAWWQLKAQAKFW